MWHPSTDAGLEGSQKDQPARGKLRVSLGFRVIFKSALDVQDFIKQTKGKLFLLKLNSTYLFLGYYAETTMEMF